MEGVRGVATWRDNGFEVREGDSDSTHDQGHKKRRRRSRRTTTTMTRKQRKKAAEGEDGGERKLGRRGGKEKEKYETYDEILTWKRM